MNDTHLNAWGLSDRFCQEATIYENLELARITEQHRNIYRVVCESGMFEAAVSGRFAHNAADSAGFPAVGDWVMIERQGSSCVIHHVLTRKSAFVRRAAGTAAGTQVVAANIDRVFLCMALNEDYNLRRLERYLAIAWDSGATPLVVLTKADLCADVAGKLREVERVAPGTDTIVCSALEEDGYSALLPHIEAGKTVAFIGSSGVGKSTLINRLLGEEALATREVRGDGKGRHTTTSRQLLPLPGGAVVLDTPGMRELGAVAADVDKSFSDIAALAADCRFFDCSHTAEPGCAVRAAIESGALDEARFENYRKIQTEADYAGLSSRQIEDAKINRMFGGKNEMKQTMRAIKKKNDRR